ncbi:MAG: class I SAM-dependent methyltransferase [Gemmatimonadales bacterium]|jgi:2-polyprenyl-6-hydroxyphenyl methylase/3-demethylubiquinone-9 3-methyltransferase
MGYYSEKLSAHRLRRCYELAPPRVQHYLEAEIDFVLQYVRPSFCVLELGCGYGRVLARLVDRAATVLGIDTSLESLQLARRDLGGTCQLAAMDAVALAFADAAFDLVICVQNGIAAFGVDKRTLIEEAVRVTRPGGTVLFSTYSEKFWDQRLEWFRIQAAHGLIGELDPQATGDGVIACKDGFRAETVSAEGFRSLLAGYGPPRITEVDGSSLFCGITAP